MLHILKIVLNGFLWRARKWPNLTFFLFLFLLLVYAANYMSMSESVRPILLFGNTLHEMQSFTSVYASIALLIYLLPIGSFGGLGVIVSFSATEYFTNYTTYCNECVAIQLFMLVLMGYFVCLPLSARLRMGLVELCQDTGGDAIWGRYDLRGYQPELHFITSILGIPVMRSIIFIYVFLWSVWLFYKLHPSLMEAEEERTKPDPITSNGTV